MAKRIALITGSNSDIGVEICRRYLHADYEVIAIYHQRNEQLQPLICEHEKKLTTLQADFEKPDAVQELIDLHSDLFAHIDVFVSMAAYRSSTPYGEISSVELMKHFAVNVIPVVLLTQYLGEQMSLRGWGRIIVGSSIGVKFGGGNDSYCYSLTKYASELIPKKAKQWAHNGVLTNVARIGVTNTDYCKQMEKDALSARTSLIPVKRVAEPAEIAESIFWLGSESNTFITGQVIALSGGE